MASEKFCLKWNDFERNISSAFRDIRDEKEFFDITLACEDEQLSAHRVILSACSPFFKTVLRRNPHQHPLLYLKGVTFRDMQAVLNFMYHGEVNVAQDDLNSFLQVAEDLQVKGLTQNHSSSNNTASSAGTSTTPPRTKTEPLSSSAGGRVRLSAEADPLVNIQPPPKRARNLISNRNSTRLSSEPTVSEDDDIQEVIPVKSEPSVMQSGGEGQAAGTMAMYEDGGEEEQQLVGGYEDSAYQEDEEYGDYNDTEQYNMAGAQDAASGNMVTCSYCPKVMYRRNLSRHVTVKHTNIQPSVCSICNKIMKSEWSLKEHERKSHGILQSQKDFASRSVLAMPTLPQVDTQAQPGPPHQEHPRLPPGGLRVRVLQQPPQKQGLLQQAHAGQTWNL